MEMSEMPSKTGPASRTFPSAIFVLQEEHKHKDVF